MLGKGNEVLSDQQEVFQERKSPRYSLNAGITIEGFDGEGKIENISNAGCCMESATYVSIIPDTVYLVTIIPAKNENLRPFSQKLKASWTKSSEKLFQAGFSLAEGQSNDQLDKYVQLLGSRGAIPNYGNTGKGK